MPFPAAGPVHDDARHLHGSREVGRPQRLELQVQVSPGLGTEANLIVMVVILIVAAVITPPDISAQIIVTIPILILYELSINIARVVARGRTAALNAQLAENNGVS